MAIINGTNGNDVLVGTAVSDLFVGSGGFDTYVFGASSGQDTLDLTTTYADYGGITIQMDALAISNVTFSRAVNSPYDLVLSINGTTDTLTIKNYSWHTPHINFQFSDGLLDWQAMVQMQLPELWVGTDGNDYIHAWGNGPAIINGNAGADVVIGSEYDDVISGGDGNDDLSGGSVSVWGPNGWMYNASGNDILDGGAGDDTLHGMEGNDTLIGGAGNDLYWFNLGDGQDVIQDFDVTSGDVDTIRFGPGIVASDITGVLNGNDLVLRIAGTTDQITVQNWGAGDLIGIERILFADGAIWDTAKITNLIAGSSGVINGTARDDFLQGTTGDDVINGLAGNDWLSGGAGNDTYLFDIGSGQDVIEEFDTTAGNVDVVQFGAGVQPANVTTTRGGASGNDLVLSINGTTDTLTIANYFAVNSVYMGTDPVTGMPIYQDIRANTVEEVRFADGTVWTQAQLDQSPIQGTAGDDIIWGSTGNDVIQGLAGNDHLLANSGDDILDGGAGNDFLQGDMGSDTYLFDIGGGQDTILDYDWTGTSLDVVQFGAGVQPANVTTTRGGASGNDLVLSINGTTDTLTIANYFAVNSVYMGTDPVTGMPIYQDVRANTVEEVRFADGTVWTQAQLDQSPIQGTAGDDIIWGSTGNDVMNGLAGDDQLMGNSGNDVLDGGAGNDVLVGDVGNDTYLFDIGGGQDTILDYDWTGTSLDVVQFGAGVLSANVSTTRGGFSGNDLVLSINGTTDTLTIANYFAVYSVYMGTDPVTGMPIYQDVRANTVEEVRFADGTVWTQAQLDVINGTAGDDILQGTMGNDVMNGLAGNDQLMGGAGNDTLDGGAGNDVLVGDMGNDTYLFDIGGGQDTILDYDWTGTALDVVQFGAGVQPANVTTTRGGASGNDLVLSINGTTDTLTIANYFGVVSTYMGTDPLTGMPIYQDIRANTVEEVRFADGTVWTQAQLDQSPIQGTAGDDIIWGSTGNDVIQGLAGNDQLLADNGDDVLDGGAGNDFLQGNIGNDTYLFDIGCGQDTILDYDWTGTSLDVVQFGTGVLPGNVTAARGGYNNNDLVLSISGTTDTLTISNYFLVTQIVTGYVDSVTGLPVEPPPFPVWDPVTNTLVFPPYSGVPVLKDVRANAVEEVRFADGTIWTQAQLDLSPIQGTAGDDVIWGSTGNDVIQGLAGNDQLLANSGDDILDGGAGNDFLQGNIGNDTYLFDVGGGQDMIGEYDFTGTSVDVVQFGPGVRSTDVTATRGGVSGNELILSINGTTDTLTVANYFTVVAAGSPVWDPATGTTVTSTQDLRMYAIEEVRFADGTVWDNNAIAQMTNRAPVAAPDSIAVGADGVAVISQAQMLANDTDPDAGALSINGFDAVSAQGNAVTQDANGNFVLGIGNRYQSLGAGQTASDSFSYTITDEFGATSTATVNITITGTNDAPVVVADVAAVQEDLSIAVTGNVLTNDSDVDHGTVLQVSQTGVYSGQYGQLNLAADGSYTYALFNNSVAVQSLGQGQVVTETFVYEATDGVAGTVSTITFNITGTNDAPVVTAEMTAVQEDINITVAGNVLTNASDADSGTVLAIANAGALQGNYGNLVLNADGTYSYALDNALAQTLGAGQTVTEIFAYQATDGITTTSSTLNVTITGTNDAPVVIADTAAVQEDLNIAATGNVLANDSDVDQGTTLTVSPSGVYSGLYGQLDMQSDGTYTYTLYNNSHEVQSLAQGQTVTESFVYQATDGVVGTVSTISFTITGSNDAPVVLSSIAAQSVSEDSAFTFTIPAGSFADIDQGDVLAYSATLADGGALPTWLVFDAATQTFSGTPTNGDVGSLSFVVKATDTGGLSASGTFVINVANVNDAPVVSASLAAQSITEGQAFSYVLPANSFSDVDAGDVLTYSATLANGNALPAWLSFNAATRTFSGTPGTGSLDNLNIVVTATDTGGLAASSSFTLAVNANVITGTSAKNTLNGTVYDDVINGLAGADTMKGGLGNDTYIVDNTGDVVTENANAGMDSVQSSVTYTLGSNVENLTLTGTTAINGTGNTLNNLLVGNTANNTLSGGSGNDILRGGAGNDTLTDSSGNNVLDGGDGADKLTGNSGKELFIGGTGNDTITTGTGADIIAFNRGDGADIVNASTGADNTISLGKGINYSDLALSKVNNDLILEVGGGEQITLSNWYATTANYKSVVDLQVMADAIAAFDPASSDPLLNQAVQNFDFTAIVNAFDQARGTSATYMHWSATNTLLTAHLSGSDTAALGGDLAHQYGTSGSLAGMSLATAQTTLNDTKFGSTPQTLQPLQGLQGGALTL